MKDLVGINIKQNKTENGPLTMTQEEKNNNYLGKSWR